MFFCYKKYEIKQQIPIYESVNEIISDSGVTNDRFVHKFGSVEIDTHKLNTEDILTILEMMPNKRYSKLIRLRYLEEKSNEKTAQEIGMSMNNYYNKHKLAKAQFIQIYGKEGQYV